MIRPAPSSLNMIWVSSKRVVRFLLVCCLLAGLHCLAGRSAAEQLPIRNYTITEGLAHGRVANIVRDSHGFLWFCTYDGLSRFDGNNFVNYNERDGLIHSRLNNLLETRDGTYWVTTNLGLSSFVPTRDSRLSAASSSGSSGSSSSAAGGTAGKAFFTNYIVGNDKGSNAPSPMLEDRAGRLWIGTQGGLYLAHRPAPGQAGAVRFERIPVGHPTKPDHLFEVETLLEDDEGSLWIGSIYGLARRLPDGRFVHYSMFPSEGLDYARTMRLDDKGRLWIGHHAGLMIYKPEPAAAVPTAKLNAGFVALEKQAQQKNLLDGRLILPFTPGEARWYTEADGLVDRRVRAICQTSDGHIWLGTVNGGLAEFDGTQFRTYDTKQGLSRLIMSLVEDNAGNLWVGSQVNGATRISRQGFSTYRESDGLGMADVFSIFENRVGELTVVNNGWYINRLDGKKFVKVVPNLPDDVKGAGTGNRPMIQSHDGEWWIATGNGLYRFPAVAGLEDLATVKPKAVYLEKDGMASSNISRLFEDSRGDVWAGSYTPPVTLTRWERATGKLYRYGVTDGIPPDNWPHVFAEDHAGNVWMGLHYGEIMRWRHGRLDVFKSVDGGPEGPSKGIMLGLYCDSVGRLWIATEGGGAARVDDPDADRPRFAKYTMQQGLSSNTMHSFTEDRWGRIYIGTARGVDRLDVATGQIRHFTAGEGLSKGEIEAAFADRHGALWFGTREGLSKLLPEERDPQVVPPPVSISSVIAGGQPQHVPELGQNEIRGLTLDTNQSQIQIEFFGLSFVPGEPLRYQYKFEGVDREWSAPSEQRTITASLSPGPYRFAVRAVGTNGQTSLTPATVTFRILPPFYQRWWFIALTVALLAAAGYYAYRLRIKRVIEIERVRTRIATDLHDDIGASLSRVAILSEVVKQQGVHNGHGPQSSQMLTEIADSARGLVDSMSDIVWSIDPRRDELSHVVTRARQFAADVLDAQGVAWQFIAPVEIEKIHLDPEQRRHLFLILKEAVNNIARHAACRNVTITMSVSGNHLLTEINDDGQGFAPQVLSNAAKTATAVLPKSRGGNGLGNMQARAAELGGTLTIDSTAAKGTRLFLSLPIKTPMKNPLRKKTRGA